MPNRDQIPPAVVEALDDQRLANEHLVLAAARAQELLDFAEARAHASERRLEHQTARHLADMADLQNTNRLATLGKLTASIAHELGTPLAVVHARAQMIANGEVPAGELPSEAAVIVHQAERMTRMVSEMLELVRPKAAIKVPVDLALLGRQTASMLAPLTRKDRVKLEFDDGAAATVLGDSSRIIQILTNLILNAKQSMAGAGVIRLRLAARRACPPGGTWSDFVAFDVTDEGSGIAPEILPRIFDTFFTTKEDGEGTGLGLSVSKRIATEHGGFIGVSSEVGRGSCFTLYLPPHDDPKKT